MVANKNGSNRYKQEAIELLLKAQIENSLDLGWKSEDIIILANFEFEFMNVKTKIISLNDFCLTGSKCFGVKYIFDNNLILDDEILFVHDLDAWQNVYFKCPKIRDVGIATYSTKKLNGGVIFWKKSGIDILNAICDEITKNKESREEPTLNRILKSDVYKKRVKVVNSTFNLGCSGYVPRYQRAEKPVKVVHFHPYNSIAWETHTMDRNGVGEIAVSRRLERLIRKYYINLPIKLSNKGEKRRKEIMEERIKNPKK